MAKNIGLLIRGIIMQEGYTIETITQEINKKYKRKLHPNSLGRKLRTETLKYKEACEIAEILGYKIEWNK